MKKNRHSWLFVALTLMLGVAVLTAAIAAPSLRVVLSSPAAVLERSVSGALVGQAAQATQAETKAAQVQAASAASAAVFNLGEVSPQGYTGEGAGQTPPNYMATVEDEDARYWNTTTIVDVFGDGKIQENHSYTATRNPAYDADMGGKFMDAKLLYPGTSGSYTFTVKNTFRLPETGLPTAIAWRLEITDENDNKVPMQFKLRQGSVDGVGGTNVLSVTNDWVAMPAGGLAEPVAVAALNTMNIGGSEEFTLDWQWPYEKLDAANAADAGRDSDDTKIGEKVPQAKTPESMPNYRLHFKLYAEAEKETFTLRWIDGATGEEYLPAWEGVEYGETVQDYIKRMAEAGKTVTVPYPPKRPGYIFKGFNDKDGVPVVLFDEDGNVIFTEPGYKLYPDSTTGEQVLSAYLTVYGEWEDTSSVILPPEPILPPWWWVPLLPLIPLIPLLPLLPLLPFLPIVPLLPLIPFLPGWIGKLLVPDKCCCDGGEDCKYNDKGECTCGKDDCKCKQQQSGNTTTTTKPGKHPDGYVKPPKTGDTLNLLPVYVLLALSTGAAVVLGKKRKKED